MDASLASAAQWAAHLPPTLVLLVAFSLGVIETIFPPAPSEGLLLAIAFADAGARSPLPPIRLAVAAALGSFLSLYMLYLLGRGHAQDAIRRGMLRINPKVDAAAAAWYGRWGYYTILVSRFIPAVRGPIVALAGSYGLKPAPVGILLLIGCLAWNYLVVRVGTTAGQLWDGTTGGLIWAIVGLAILAVVGFFAVRMLVAGMMRKRNG